MIFWRRRFILSFYFWGFLRVSPPIQCAVLEESRFVSRSSPVKTIFFLAAVLGLCGSAAAQAFTCPSATKDMLNYFVMAYPNRLDRYLSPDHANPIYTSPPPTLQPFYPSPRSFSHP